MAPAPVRVFVLYLEDDGSADKHREYVRLPPPVEPFILRLSIAAGSKASWNSVLHTNYPIDGSEFQRHKFHKQRALSKPITVDILIKQSGAFSYYFVYHSQTSTSVKSPPGFFNVDPILEIPSRTSILDQSSLAILPPGKGGNIIRDKKMLLPLDGLAIQTVLAPWMGPMSEWKPHLDIMRDRGYNAIHFAPLQQLGSSGSPYSISDQHLFSNSLFSLDNTPDSSDERVRLVSDMVKRIKDEWGMLSITDIVINHTSRGSPWLQFHPEGGYNLNNSPHLKSAEELDRAILTFSAELEAKRLPTNLKAIEDLDQVMKALKADVINPLRLWEYYVVDVSGTKKAFADQWKTISEASLLSVDVSDDLHTMDDQQLASEFSRLCLPTNWHHLSDRFSACVIIPNAVSFLSKLQKLEPSHECPDAAVEKLGQLLDIINMPRYSMFDEDVECILINTRNDVKYKRLDSHGPKLGPITATSPIVEPLFTRLPQNETTSQHEPGSLTLANAGWIWGQNSAVDFASAESRAYVRRDVIVWSDSVKLRYGESPEDNPFLWDYMGRYATIMAKTFAGFRIDNCHSTAMHVGEYLLDAARQVNPDLYICAELFTGNQEADLYYVKNLGINSLIREALNGYDPKDQSSFLYRYGLVNPVGSMDADCLTETTSVFIDGKERKAQVAPHQGSVPHALIMDVTHDNEAPAQKRTAEDALPLGSLVTFSTAAIGSNRGFDDLYARHVGVAEKIRYDDSPSGLHMGIGIVKRLLNHLHMEMALGGFVECHFSQEGNYIMSHRVDPQTNKGYFLIAHTAFQSEQRGYVKPVRLYETKMKFIYGASLEILGKENEDSQVLKGFRSKLVPIPPVEASEQQDKNGQYSEVIVPDSFPAGSVMVYSTRNDNVSPELTKFILKDAEKAVSGLDLVDMNAILYRANGEELDATNGQCSVYDVPGSGPLTYCGLEGWMVHLRHIIRFNDLGHPLCANLRSGPWALEYLYTRLEKQCNRFPRLNGVASWLKERVDCIKAKAPPYLRPRFFAILVHGAYSAAVNRSISLMSDLVKDGPSFTRNLALCSVQLYGVVQSASLDPGKSVASQAAGLPHFASGWARVWGRDCAIASRIFLTTGQFDAARQHILALASTLKHGLIPNLIDSIRAPRYNSRDSPWFFLQLIQDYVMLSPEGTQFLEVKAKRRFPIDDTWVSWDDDQAYAHESTMKEIVFEILQRHASGIHFREWNAGVNLDMQMKDEGFNIDIDVDWETGFIFGGNEFNCGTWMDKNGESEKAGTKGLPGTPRDGAPVEIIGLLKSALRWCEDLSRESVIQNKGVQAKVNGESRLITFNEWSELLQKSFEKHFFIPSDASDDKDYKIDIEHAARRGIYKDVYGSGAGRERSDYQLRCNFPIAMVVAPELFNSDHARKALEFYAKALIGPLGVATLDPKDPDYRPNYYNSDDSDDFLTAKGRNYHQGPEWVWPLGYFLRAYFHFNKDNSSAIMNEDLEHKIHSFLKQHRLEIETSLWRGLPELTNQNGSYCEDSCRTQAWSASTLLDVLDDINRAEKKKVG